MALPPNIQKRRIRERLNGLVGKARLNEIKKLLSEFPGYSSGPYGEMRKNLMKEIETTKTRSKIKHQDWLGVPRQGDKQFCLVGCPSVGKSSLLSKLSGMKIKIANYAFTTLKPIPAVINFNGAHIQIVDLPGLIEGATEDIGGGKRLIGIIKNCDGVILISDLTKPISELEKIAGELEKAEIDKPVIVLGNKLDLAKGNLPLLKERFSKYKVIGMSVTKNIGLDEFRETLWDACKLIRIYPEKDDVPMILDKGSTIEDFAGKVHKRVLKELESATISGPSAKFPNQKVGLKHVLEDNDHVKINTI
jgi:small GTP-binding protein